MEEDIKLLPKYNISLDKKYITGKLDKNSPICVIEEIVSSYNMVMDSKKYIEDEEYKTDVLYIINDYKPIYIKYPYTENDISSLVTYINNIQGYIWNISTITKSYYFLDLFSDHGKIGYYDPIENFDLNINNCGLMKPQMPEIYTPCIIYRIAIKRLMKINSDTSMDDMIKYISLHHHDKKFILSNIFNMY